MARKCSVSGCEGIHKAHGFCIMHYRRLQRNGDACAPLRKLPSDEVKLVWLNEHSTWKDDECLQWPFAKAANGSGAVRVSKKQWTASALMCTIAHGEKPTGKHEAVHSCGNWRWGCVNPNHLRWETRSKSRKRKIKDSDLEKMLHMRRDGKTLREIAHDFNCSISYTHKILTCKTGISS